MSFECIYNSYTPTKLIRFFCHLLIINFIHIIFNTTVKPITFNCTGTQAEIALLTPYWAGKWISVKNVFVNQGCSGETDGDWHRYSCDGTVTVSIVKSGIS